jgi:brefeldin A-resistance guanine nucleotide exchange factor 1
VCAPVLHSNLFEDLVSLISKTAFPGGSKGLGPMHSISLEALLAVLQALSECLDDPPPQLQPATALDRFVDVWGPICRGEDPPLDQILGEAAAAALTAAAGAAAAGGKPTRDSASSGGYSTYAYGSYLAAAMGSSELRRIASSNASSSGNLLGGPKSRSCGCFDQALLPEQELSGYAAAIAAETAAFEKGLKQRVMLGVDHFNKDYKKGFQFLQVRRDGAACADGLLGGMSLAGTSAAPVSCNPRG